MLSEKNKRVVRISSVLLLWFAVLVFFLLVFLPAFQSYRALRTELADGKSTLQGRLAARALPSKDAVSQAEAARDVLTAELNDVRAFYLSGQRSVMDRKPLGSDENEDPYLVAARYRDLRRTLAVQTGHVDFLDVGEIDSWRRHGEDRPHPDQFSMLEKKSAIAESLVGLMTGSFGRVRTTISSMTIADPYNPPGQPDFSALDNEQRLHYRIFPVDLQVSVSYRGMQQLFNDLFTVRPDADRPFLALRSVELDMRDDTGENRVNLRLGLNVLDFHVPEPEI